MLNRQGQRKLKEWIDLLQDQDWSAPDKQYLVDYWLEHHDEDGKFKQKRSNGDVERSNMNKEKE